MNIKNNSKQVNKNDIFITTVTDTQKKKEYTLDAIKNKASAIITNKEFQDNIPIPTIKVENENDTYFQILNDYYDNPFKNLKLIGITGTDGKTSTATMINDLLNMHYKSAYLGTNGFITREKKTTTKNTTPELSKIIEYSYKLNKLNYNYLVMEASSEGLMQNRCHNLPFEIAILTNITKDHLNVHNNVEEYVKSKLKLFKYLQNKGVKILNTDSDYFEKFKKIKSKKTITYGKNKKSDYLFTNIQLNEQNTTFTLIHKNKQYQIESPFKGEFNVYNLTCSIACLNYLGIPITALIDDIKKLKPVQGRINFLEYGQKFKVIIDYAHTTYATQEILEYVNIIKKQRIITVVGCAGGRYHEKRKEIGKLVSDLSDIAIFTMDDPRYENINNIFKDMLENVKKNNISLIKNRKKAIKTAFKMANKDDIVLILGKGTDNYMAIKNKYKKYNDLDIIKKIIKKRRFK